MALKKAYYIARLGADSVEINPNGSTIAGSGANYILGNQYESVVLIARDDFSVPAFPDLINLLTIDISLGAWEADINTNFQDLETFIDENFGAFNVDEEAGTSRTLDENDTVILCTGGSGTQTLTLPALAASQEWVIFSSAGRALGTPISGFSWAIGGGTDSTSYETVPRGMVYFHGTVKIGTPSQIKMIAFMDPAITTYDLRVFDLTNGNVIAEKTGNSNTTAAIIDMGALSNLSGPEAIWELQALRVGGAASKMVTIESAGPVFP